MGQIFEKPTTYKTEDGYIPKGLDPIQECDSDTACEILKPLLFGLPLDKQRRKEADLAWSALKNLVEDLPRTSPNVKDVEEDFKVVRAIVRARNRIQVSKWDASIRFLTAGASTTVYFASGHDAFVIASSSTDAAAGILHDAALEAIKRGAKFQFLVPDARTPALTSVNQFKEKLPAKFKSRVDIVRVKPSLQKTATSGGRGLPEPLQRGQYFTPGFRPILFKENTDNDENRDGGALFIGLPPHLPGGAVELFAFRYDINDFLAKEFLRWIERVSSARSS